MLLKIKTNGSDFVSTVAKRNSSIFLTTQVKIKTKDCNKKLTQMPIDHQINMHGLSINLTTTA